MLNNSQLHGILDVISLNNFTSPEKLSFCWLYPYLREVFNYFTHNEYPTTILCKTKIMHVIMEDTVGIYENGSFFNIK